MMNAFHAKSAKMGRKEIAKLNLLKPLRLPSRTLRETFQFKDKDRTSLVELSRRFCPYVTRQ
jgi:hypothetical protein